jgi:hypothetical protein
MKCLFIILTVLQSLFAALEQKTLVSDFAITISDNPSHAANNQPITYTGELSMHGKQFMLEMFGIEAAYDGHTLYMYSEDTEELTLSIPTEEELVQTNPFLYAQALLPACQYAEKVTGNTTEITLTPKDPAAGISKFVLQITTTTLLPSLVEIHETGNKTTTLLLSNAVYTEAKPAFIIEKEGVFVNDLR